MDAPIRGAGGDGPGAPAGHCTHPSHSPGTWGASVCERPLTLDFVRGGDWFVLTAFQNNYDRVAMGTSSHSPAACSIPAWKYLGPQVEVVSTRNCLSARL